jgi:hypothetical protein
MGWLWVLGFLSAYFLGLLTVTKLSGYCESSTVLFVLTPSYVPLEGNVFFVYTSRDLPSLETIEKTMLPLITQWVELEE